MPLSATLDAAFLDPAGFFGFDDASAIDTATCYCRGTRVLAEDREVEVEKLLIGDRVMTASGALRTIRWIGRRAFAATLLAGRPRLLPVRLHAGAIAEQIPKRDLLVSPCHAMFLDGILIPALSLVNGRSITQDPTRTAVEYFHIELESHDLIIAEGALSESFVDDDSRSHFDNARQYAAIYPQAQRQPALYCAPRLQDGPEVDAVWHALAQRCGAASAADLGPLAGSVNAAGDRQIVGWAVSGHQPDVPVCLDIMIDGRLAWQVLADRGRPDCQQPANGAHGFSVNLTAPLDGRTLAVRRSADGAWLHSVVTRASLANRRARKSAHQGA